MNYTNIDDHTGLEKMADMVVVNVKHDFTETELKQESEMMAQSVTDKQATENEKKVSMAAFKNKIDTFEGKIKLHASNINHGFTYIDKAASMYRDFENKKRVYFDRQSGNFLKQEDFHPSDFQKQLDFEEEDERLRLEDIARQEQIEENNRAGNFADRTLKDDIFNPIDEVILDKKIGKGNKENPTPKDNLHPNHGRDAEHDELPYGFYKDANGNLTDINPELDMPDDDIFDSTE